MTEPKSYITETDVTPQRKKTLRIVLLVFAVIIDFVNFVTVWGIIFFGDWWSLIWTAGMILASIVIRLLAHELVFKYIYVYSPDCFLIKKAYPHRTKKIFCSSKAEAIMEKTVELGIAPDRYMKALIFRSFGSNGQ